MLSVKKPRIALYGGLANNMYVFAKCLAKAGAEVRFYRDLTDIYPISQPVWEDMPFSMDFGDPPRSIDQWNRLETDIGWRAPDWLIDIRRNGPPPDGADRYEKSHWTDFLRSYLYTNANWPKLVAEFRRHDLLIVCGVEGIHLAYLSGTPYLIWPHGGDIRAAAGYPPIRFAGFAATARRIADRKCFARAFENANWVASHDPTAVGGSFHDSTPALGGKPLLHLPIPVPTRRRLGREERRQRRRELFSRHGVHLDPEAITLFAPSRLDFFWKGHDRLLAAASSIAGVQFLFTGWGGDQEAARAFVRDTGLAGRVAQLPYAVSKPTLFEFMDAADAVVDQFVLETYGTAAVEAMAGGTPVVMYIENSRFAKLGWAAPPVLNCSSETEIKAVLVAIASAALDLEAWGARAQMWCERIHDPTKAALCIDTIACHATQIRRKPK